jgi:hypothetical protein
LLTVTQISATGNITGGNLITSGPVGAITGTGNIIFMMIPLFNLVYGFIVYPKICESIKNEYKQLGLNEDGDFGRGLAITMCALSFGGFIPILNFITCSNRALF